MSGKSPTLPVRELLGSRHEERVEKAVEQVGGEASATMTANLDASNERAERIISAAAKLEARRLWSAAAAMCFALLSVSVVVAGQWMGNAGEIMTLQRAAYVTEDQAHSDLYLPPLTQSLEELRGELSEPDIVALGVREEGRLVGAVRLRRVGSAVELRRLTIVPDRQSKGVGTFCLARPKRCSHEPGRCNSSLGSTQPRTSACTSSAGTSRRDARP